MTEDALFVADRGEDDIVRLDDVYGRGCVRSMDAPS